MQPDYIALPGNRSDSDDGRYVQAVRRAVQSPAHFQSFKRDPDYTLILEHVGEPLGATYLDVIRQSFPHALAHLDAARANDLLGDPATFVYEGAGRISPTTLRYLKVAAELRHLFGDLSRLHVAEVGVGYGGQCLVLDRLAPPRTYHLFDLPPVLELAAKVLESHILTTGYRTQTLNGLDPQAPPFDLVVSNYAFSELPQALQRMYVMKVLGRAQRGYLTMNHVPGTAAKMTLEMLREVLPPFEVQPERPLSSPGNFLIVWGHTGS